MAFTTTFTIDGVAVPVADDIRTDHRPGGLTARRTERFPGDATLYVLKGVQLLPRLVVTGRIYATSLTTLNAALDTQAGYLDDDATATVVANDVTYQNMDLAQFEILSPVRAYRTTTGTVRVFRMCRWVFEQLEAPA